MLMSLITHSIARAELLLFHSPVTTHLSTKLSILYRTGSVLVPIRRGMAFCQTKACFLVEGSSLPELMWGYPATFLFQHRSSLTLTTDDENATPHTLRRCSILPHPKNNIFLRTIVIDSGETHNDKRSALSSCNPCDCLVACDSGSSTAPDIWTIYQTASQCL